MNWFQKIVYGELDVDAEKAKDFQKGTANNPTESYRNWLLQSPVSMDAWFNQFNEMDLSSIDIATFLDKVSEEATLKNSDNHLVVWVEAENKTVAEKANKLIRRLKLDSEAADICRMIAKNGRYVVKPELVSQSNNIQRIGTVAALPANLDPIAAPQEFYYRKVETAYDDKNHWVGFNYNSTKFHPWEFVEFKLGSYKWGKSLLQDIYRFWKSLDLLYRALELFRVAKTPQTTIFRVPIGTSDPIGMLNTVKMYKRYIEQQVRNSTTPVGTQKAYDVPPSPLSSIYWPESSDRSGGVDIYSQSGDINGIEDIKLARDMFLRKLGLPLDDEIDPTKNYTSQSVSLSRKVEMVQTAYLEGVDRLLQIEFALMGMKISETSYEIKMSRTSDIEETLRLEKIMLALDTADQLFALGGHVAEDKPKVWEKYVLNLILEPYFGKLIQNFNDYSADYTDDGSLKNSGQLAENVKTRSERLLTTWNHSGLEVNVYRSTIGFKPIVRGKIDPKINTQSY